MPLILAYEDQFGMNTVPQPIRVGPFKVVYELLFAENSYRTVYHNRRVTPYPVNVCFVDVSSPNFQLKLPLPIVRR